MTAYADKPANARVARINHAARAERLLWVELTLSDIWSEVELMLVRRQSARQLPEQGIMVLTTKYGWKDFRQVWRVSPYQDAWLIDDHGQLYLYQTEQPNKPIPFSQSALRDRSMAKFDREATRDLPVTESATRDMELAQMLQNIRCQFSDDD